MTLEIFLSVIFVLLFCIKIDTVLQNNVMEKNFLEQIQKKFEGSSDFVVSDINVGEKTIHYIYIDNMINRLQLNTGIVEPIKQATEVKDFQDLKTKIMISGTEEKNQLDDIVMDILSGFVLVMMQGEDKAISCPCQGFEKRTIQEPPTSAVLKGPREGFVEDITINISLIRRKLKSSDLKVEELTVGRYTKSRVCVAYVDSIADSHVVKKIKQRLNQIDIDGIVDSYYIQAFLEEKHSKLFKQVGNSEKPEVVISKLLEGRVAVVVDGSPLVLTLPFTLLEDLQSSDDYYIHPMHASFVRMLRLWGFIISMTLPGIYVALQSFHFSLLPIDFLITLQSSIQGLSFPPLIEILVVLFLFEILNEASIRMPKYLGMALSIIGALVLGDTAVKAGVISSPAVIMVAVSGIMLYMVPDQTQTASILRIIFTVLGGIAGFYGLTVGFVWLTSYLLTFDSYGTPYFAPYAPRIALDKKDGIIKDRIENMKTRPKSIPNKNLVRMGEFDDKENKDKIEESKE